eukprot:TRINITY_DN24834_c0_g1_i1.p1 TRINITY_DN24834_c0_g1~~TRINITY_DN24834_c0_g1_i1.p1  ORF type:complete len:328 (+),score=76.12 TRINITY_DN24834_c0_g1_i1:101-985(+)
MSSRMKLFLLLLGASVEATSLRLSSSRAKATNIKEDTTLSDLEVCSCSSCRGMAITEGGNDVWTCTAVEEADPEGDEGGLAGAVGVDEILPGNPKAMCRQQGESNTWVVQTEQLILRRFCHYTCKPVVPERLTTSVGCVALDVETIQKYAQTKSGGGRSFLWKSNRLQNSPTMADIRASHRLIASGAQQSAADALRNFFRPILLKRGKNKPAKGPGCHCNCKQNATATAEANAAAAAATTTGPPLPMGPIGQAAIAATAAADVAKAQQAQTEAFMKANGITADQLAQAQAMAMR